MQEETVKKLNKTLRLIPTLLVVGAVFFLAGHMTASLEWKEALQPAEGYERICQDIPIDTMSDTQKTYLNIKKEIEDRNNEMQPVWT